MTKGKDHFGHFIETPGGAVLTKHGKESILRQARILDLYEVRKNFIEKIRYLLRDTQDIQEVSSPKSTKKLIELPYQYQKFNVDTNIKFLDVLLREINGHIKNVRRGLCIIENMADVCKFIDYVDMLISNEISQLTDNDPYPRSGQKYLNSPPPERPKGYPWDDGLPPDYPDDDNEEGKNGS